MIGIIDTESSNIQSVTNALNFLDTKFSIVDKDTIDNFDKFILPGVGSYKFAMNKLDEKNLISPIKSILKDTKKNFLGICLGMQLLYQYSEEDGLCEGLGALTGNVTKIKHQVVPNIGWRKVDFIKENDITSSIFEDRFFYHIHSFACRSENREIVIGTINYGNTIDVIVNQSNIFATQFHPEKSQKSGLKILENFISV